jgi:integrase
MPHIHLTVESVKGIEHPAKGQLFFWDTKLPGFGLRVGTRSKTFIAEKRVEGRSVRVSLGLYGQVTVAQARTDAAVKLGQMAGGADLNAQKRAKEVQREAVKAQKAAGATHTVKALCDSYIAHLKKLHKQSTVNAANLFKNWIENTEFAEKPARELTPKEAAVVIRRVVEAGKGRTAGKLRSYWRAAYALAQGADTNPQAPSDLLLFGIETNPIAAVAALSSFNKTRSTVVPDQLLAEVLRQLRQQRAEQYDDALAALELSLWLAGQRPQQVLQLDERDIDLDGETLTLWDPKGKRKEPRRHVLPLAKEAKALVVEILSKKRATWLFGDASARTTGTTLSRKGGELLTKARTALSGAGGTGGASVQPRDLRRTAETALAAMGISKDTRAQLLSHGLGGVQDRHYDQHSYMTEKRAALVAWEARLLALMKGKAMPSNVKRLRRA